jgi:hypothetical protein
MSDESSTRVLFTSADKELIAELIKPHSEVLQNRSRGKSINKQKDSVWELIVNQFNTLPIISSKRSVKQIQKCWENMKSATKKEVSNHKQSLRKTGGGGAVQTLGTITEKVADIISDYLHPLSNPYDCDAQHHHYEEAIETYSQSFEPINESFENGSKKLNIKQKQKVSKAPKVNINAHQNQVVMMRTKEHRLKMKKLRAEIAYLKNKTEWETNLFSAIEKRNFEK